MSTIQIMTLLLLTSVAVVLGYVALMNVASCFPESMWPRTNTLMLASLICVSAPLWYLAISQQSDVALATASIEGFICALIAYFLGQRYEGPVFASDLIRRKPSFFPTAALAYFSFSASFLCIAKGWLWGLLPILIWLILGYACVEMAVKREQRRLARYDGSPSRERAICVLNQYQGRVPSMFESGSSYKKYPFP